MNLYFKVCDQVSGKGRNLIHFEAAICYVEQLNTLELGVIQKYREYLQSKVLDCVMRHGRDYYKGKQLSQYQAYVTRIFKAML